MPKPPSKPPPAGAGGAGLRGLEAYRQKRSASRTPEPFGKESARPRAFVVQKHGARRLHYDFRLEWNGVLLSWAVPHGPSLDPAEKRLAVHVEDHPVDYADFEGVIPAGEYGAGPVIVWDKGQWIPIEDPEEGLARGKLLFDLKGYKLRGRWTLVRTKRKSGDGRGKQPEWLLIKKRDGYAAAEGEKAFSQESVLSGLTLEEMRDGSDRAVEVLAALTKARAARRRVSARGLSPMLAETREAAFSHKDWIFEVKYDGFRLLCEKDGEDARVYYRRGKDSSVVFPEIITALRKLPYEHVVLDGEVVVLDEEGRPSFQRLQKRTQLTRPRDIERASVELPATLFAFDLLGFGDYDLMGLPVVKRKELLQRILPGGPGPVRYAEHFPETGEALYAGAEKLGLEGIVAKKADSRYLPGKRTPAWLKIRVDRVGDFAVVGYTAPKRTRSGFGALHLASWDPDDKVFVYAGRVGTGFSDRQLKEIRAVLDEDVVAEPAFRDEVPPSSDRHTWVTPRMVVEVRYKEFTEDGNLRQPSLLRVRDDKAPEECVRVDGLRGRGGEEAQEPPAPPPESLVEKKVPYTNLDKVFWPEEGYTKGDLIEYYRQVSPWLLAYLKDRPLVMTRYPDGIEGKSFFQKDAPEWAPGWVRTERLWSQHAEREIDYFICDDEESLLYVANLGTIPLHIWSSRNADLAHPDWCILDLDPKGAPFEDVVKVALAIRKLCDEIELPTFVKTSGSTGIHVLVPLGGQCTYEQSKQLGELLGSVVSRENPDVATIERSIPKRRGRVYVDFVQNGHGRLLVAPFSVRPLPGAPVSAPLAWREVNKRLTMDKFTIRTLPKRMARLEVDPMVPVLTTRPNLLSALHHLASRLQGTE